MPLGCHRYWRTGSFCTIRINLVVNMVSNFGMSSFVALYLLTRRAMLQNRFQACNQNWANAAVREMIKWNIAAKFWQRWQRLREKQASSAINSPAFWYPQLHWQQVRMDSPENPIKCYLVPLNATSASLYKLTDHSHTAQRWIIWNNENIFKGLRFVQFKLQSTRNCERRYKYLPGH